MAAQTFTAREVARIVAKRTGKPCDGKRVRAWARQHVQRFDDDAYTTHAYTAAERDRIVNAMVAARKATATGPAARASSASRGRSGRAAKVAKPTKPTKDTTVHGATPQGPAPVATVAKVTDPA